MKKGKSKNPFKFQGFAERIANIKIDVAHRVQRTTAEPEESETFCYESLTKWRELNCTIHFQNFLKEIGPLVETLPQLVHHEKAVISVVEKHLLIKDTLALEPILDFVVQLARDLQCNFYSYFDECFDIFITLLGRYSLNSEALEQIFTTIGYLFKFLWKYLIKDMDSVFKLYSPLFRDDQKPYIHQFAAESFAFLVRKVKDQSQLFDLIFKTLDDKIIKGVGYLLFESVKSMSKQFHSKTSHLLQSMLSKLGPAVNERYEVSHDLHLPWKLVFQCLSYTFQLMTKYTSSEHSQMVEQCLTKHLMDLYMKSKSIPISHEPAALKALVNSLSFTLQLTNQWVSWKNGCLVTQPLLFYDVVRSLLQTKEVAKKVSEPLLCLVSSILQANFTALRHDIHIKELIRNIFNRQLIQAIDFPLENLFIFCKSLLKWTHFKEEILHPLLSKCQEKLYTGVNKLEKKDIVLMLVEIVLSGALDNAYGIDIKSKDGLIYFPKCGTKPGESIFDSLVECLTISQETDLSLAWGVLIILPCLRPIDSFKCSKSIEEFITQSMQNAAQDKSGHWLYVISQAVLSYLLIIQHNKQLKCGLGIDFITNMLSHYCDNVHILHACHAVLSQAKSNQNNKMLSTQNLESVFPLLKANLSNSAHLVRLTTLQILNEFEQFEFKAIDEKSYQGSCNIFQLCVDAESALPTFQQYRSKDVLLRKLTYSKLYYDSLPEFYEEVSLRFLIGQLYINFSPTWQTVMEVIKSLTDKNNVKVFWSVYKEHLDIAATNTEKELSSEFVSTGHPVKHEEGAAESLYQLYTNVFNIAVGQREDNRTDHRNFRYLLWKTMAEFPGIVELKSRDLVPLFLKFMRNEYEFCDESTASTQDICHNSVEVIPSHDHSHHNQQKCQDDDYDSSSKDVQSEESNSSRNNQLNYSDGSSEFLREGHDSTNTGRRKAAAKSLCIHLNLFSLFNNPKALSKEAQVRQIYLTMLGHRDGEVQKLALKCMQTYKFPYIVPYKEHLEKLLEDESFKDELTNLMMDDRESVINPEHREGLMPIIIRLLYGKMQRWTGAGSSGKAGVGARRSTVLRFLANCTHKELSVFMDLILAPFKHLCIVSEPTVDPVTSNLSCCVPIKKQIGFLNMLQQILMKLGDEADPFLPSLLQICLSLLSSCAYSLEHRDQIHPPHIPQLKQIRQLAISRLIDFFEMKPDYDYSVILDKLFDAAVWPQINNLEKESIQSPTPLLKLLHCWTQYPKFIPLLSRKPNDNHDMSIVGHVLKCLHAPNVASSVVSIVMEMTDNMLNGEDGIKDEGQVVEQDRSLMISNSSCGIHLVQPHLHVVISYLTSTVKSLSEPLTKKDGPSRLKIGVSKLELSVLSRISSYVKGNEDSTLLLNLLIPLLCLRQKEETENYVLKTIHNLISNIHRTIDFIKPLARLFSQFNACTSRQLLCDIFQKIAVLDSKFESVSNIVSQLNAWDEKKIEEPNYTSRITGFTAATQFVSMENSDSVVFLPGSKVNGSPTVSVSINHVLPILHNCLYFVHRSDDMALRDCAVNCVNSIIQRVARSEDEEEFSELVMNCILPSCKLALKAKSESARVEFLAILSTMVCHFDNSTFEDMRVLIDKDPEKDFFENMRHIQLHRRIRALHHLQVLCEKNTFKASTLVSFLLPLTTSCLHEYSSANKDHNVTTQAIKTIGAISSCLPWSKYSYLLKNYLKALQREKEKHKIIVRVLVAILDGFHFDLSIYTFNEDEPTKENITEKPEDEVKHEENNGDTLTEVHDSENEIADEEDVEEADSCNIIHRTLAIRIYTTITKTILPQLNRSLTKKTQSFHKLANMKREDEEDALRVPIVLAIVKLLQFLPQQTLHLHLPGLLLRVCVTLKSRARDVRDTARDVLCQVALSLGTKYFSFILKELKSTLARGYQLHVLGYTLHSLLDKMSPKLSPGDLDHCVPDITQVLIEDLFGEVATERDVEKLANKLHEAKSTKSYDSFEIIARYIGSTSLSLLVTPLQEVLNTNQNYKISKRVEETLRRVSVGLQANTDLSLQNLMVFIHRIVNEKLPLLAAKKQTEEDELNLAKGAGQSQRAQDSYLIPSNPVRGGKSPGTSNKTNSHVIVEFGLQMLNITLKRGKMSTADQSHLELFDPFVSVLIDCLCTKYNKVMTLSLRNLCFITKLPLPSLDRHIPNIAKLLFKILQKHAKAGGKVGENYEMVLSAFKAMTVIVRDFNKYTIAQKHLQVLLGFVEEDIHDYTRHGTAFPLLKAILTRKLVAPEIHDVMNKVCQLSITGATPTVQQQSRQCVIKYVLDYPLGKKLQRLLEFFASQLSYEHETGRLSALEMMITFFNAFPETLLFRHSSFFFVPLTTRLVNDDSANCRKLTASAIKTLLQKLDVERRDGLFAMVIQWFTNDKVVLRRLAAQLCGVFVEVECKAFDRRLQTALPLISELINPKFYETDEHIKLSNDDSTTLNRSMDHLLFNILTTFAKILQENKAVMSDKYRVYMNTIWDAVESHLLHPHTWVRLVSSRLFGLLFANWNPEELVTNTSTEIFSYFTNDTYNKIVRLCDDFCAQLESPYLQQQLSDQIVKNLVFLAQVLLRYDMDVENEHEFTLSTLFGKIEKLATHEASQTPKQTAKRSCAMRWIAAIAMVLGKDKITPYLKDILQPIHRELEIKTTYKDPELQKVTQEVLELVKGIVGRDSISRVYANLQRDVSDLKEKRKKKRALEAVADPSQSARKKMKRNLSKKEARKRKIDKFKPERKLKKTRFIEQDD